MDTETPASSKSKQVLLCKSKPENNVSSDGSLSYSVEDICQKIKELGLPEAANKFRGKKPHLLI
jgi:hypothetical protein